MVPRLSAAETALKRLITNTLFLADSLTCMRRSHYWHAWTRDTVLLFRQFRGTLLVFTLILTSGLVLLTQFYVHPETGARVDWGEALYATLGLIVFQPSLPFPQAWGLRLFYIVVPLVGLGAVLDGVVRFTTAFLHRTEHKEAWQMALASTYSNHVVICGLGRVGFRVMQQLLDLGEEIVAVERKPDSRFVEQARALDVPVIIGDAREPFWLEKAGVERAAALIACTEDDLTNLDIALDARRRNPQIKAVVRMFDPNLAEKVKDGFNISAVYSTSALSAPFFVAAATQRSIEQTLSAGETMVSVARFTARAGTPAAGKTVAEVETLTGAQVIFIRTPDHKVTWNPSAETVIVPGMRVALAGSLESAQAIAALQRPKEPVRFSFSWRRKKG